MGQNRSLRCSPLHDRFSTKNRHPSAPSRLAQGDYGRAAGRHDDFWRERGARLCRLNADRRNDLVPIVDLGGDEAGEFFGRAAHCVQALKLHLGDDVRRF
jgi:hypothetical protein